MSIRRITFPLLAAAVLALSACGTMAPKEKSLYERLGGKEAIAAVVDELTANVAKDERINWRFKNADIPRFKAHMVDFLCAGTGGPCVYKGRDMKTVHTGMKITEGEFGAVAENAVKALDKFNVPAGEKNEVLGLLGSMKGDIINR